MSPLTRTVVAACIAAAVLVPRSCFADDKLVLAPQAKADDIRLTLGAGYASAWTSGSTDFGPSLGGALSYVTRTGHVVALDVTRFFGGGKCAPGVTEYCVSTSALTVDLGLGHRFGRTLFVEPRVGAGVLFVFERTSVIESRLSSIQGLFQCGPSLTFGLKLGKLVAAVELDAHVAPARIASPWLGGALTLGVVM